jgi:hypothetical protein
MPPANVRGIPAGIFLSRDGDEKLIPDGEFPVAIPSLHVDCPHCAERLKKNLDIAFQERHRQGGVTSCFGVGKPPKSLKDDVEPKKVKIKVG